MKKKHHFFPFLSRFYFLLIIFTAALFFFFAISNFQEGQNEEYRKKLEESIRLSAVACYANEGTYPPNLEYLIEHYGIQIDTEKYAVFYDIFAGNIMPDITVVSLK